MQTTSRNPPLASLTASHHTSATDNGTVRSAHAAPAVPYRKRSFSWPYFFAAITYFLWQVLTKIVLGVVYFTLIADGLRQFVPPLGLKLYKAIPGLSFLQDYEATHRLDIAQLAALILMIFVWIAWGKVLQHWLVEPNHSDDEATLATRAGSLNAILAAVLLVGDLCLFYLSLVRVTWSGTTFSASALLATVVYAGIVVFAVLHSMSLRRKCVVFRNQENHS